MEEDAPQGELMPKDIIESRSKIKGIIECNGIWMAGGRFGVTWKLLQTAVRPPKILLVLEPVILCLILMMMKKKGNLKKKKSLKMLFKIKKKVPKMCKCNGRY